MTPQAQALLRWRLSPELLVREAFGVEPDDWQVEALNAIAKTDRLTIKSGHGVGKSAYLSWLIIWWLLTREKPVILCTAPGSSQLEDILWGEVSRWMSKLPKALQNQFEIKSDKIERKTDPNESFAAARTARKEKPEALQGYHAGDLLFIIDEASGVDDVVFSYGKGSMSTLGAKTVMTGNPTRVSGYFHRSHTHPEFKNRWYRMTVNGETAKMVTQNFIDDIKAEFGEDSDEYRVRVLGDFPTGEINTVIPLSILREAIDRDVEPIPGRVIWGVDVARFGDDASALAKREKNILLEPVKSWKNASTMQTAGIIVDEFERAKRKPDVIVVDSIGLGAGVADRLIEQGLPARALNVSESPSIKGKYLRLRDELWFKGREWFMERNCIIPDDDDLITELIGPAYTYSSTGKVQVESKVEMKKRGIPSPNKADAFLATFAESDQGYFEPLVDSEPVSYGWMY